MGMDVYGKNPANEAGEYFRANCWSWRPIHNALSECGGTAILGEETMLHMGYNDGAGATDADQCEKLATALEQMVEDMEEPIYSPEELNDPNFQCTTDGTFVDAATYEGETVSPYEVDVSHMRQFITFLRNCGDGFEVW